MKLHEELNVIRRHRFHPVDHEHERECRIRIPVMHPKARIEKVYGSKCGIADIRDSAGTPFELDDSPNELWIKVAWVPPHSVQVEVPRGGYRYLGRFFDQMYGAEFIAFTEHVETDHTTAPRGEQQQQR